MKVYLCYVLKNHKYIVMKVISDYDESRKWSKDRTQKIIKMEKLIAKYYLARSEKEKSKAFSKWHNFAKNNNLGLHEDRIHHHIHTWDVDKEASIEDLIA